MKETLSNRHEGDLGGKLSPFGEAKHPGVTVEIAADHAASASVQHAAWMLLNLLCRLKGVLSQVSVRCPKDVSLAGRITPLGTRNTDLREALFSGAESIGGVPVGRDVKLEQTIVIGSEVPVLGTNFYLWANGWCGGFSREPLPFPKAEEASHLPIGPYVAAGLVAAEMFKFARQKNYEPTRVCFHSLWDYSVSEAPISGGPSEVDIQIDVALAGVGAVGCAFLHTLWACDGVKGKLVLADNDKNGLELTNLNRYLIFGSGSVGAQKATAASAILSNAPVTWIPHDSAFEVLHPRPQFVVSAVDKNASRIAIQSG